MHWKPKGACTIAGMHRARRRVEDRMNPDKDVICYASAALSEPVNRRPYFLADIVLKVRYRLVLSVLGDEMR